jgi:O-antigen/teichoic acid export membrane protein
MEKKILKKEFKKQLKLFAKAKILGQKQKADRSIAIILTIIAAVGLLYVVTALACGLACNGAETAAILVGILGFVAIIIGTVFVIRSINRKHRQRRDFLPKSDTSL